MDDLQRVADEFAAIGGSAGSKPEEMPNQLLKLGEKLADRLVKITADTETVWKTECRVDLFHYWRDPVHLYPSDNRPAVTKGPTRMGQFLPLNPGFEKPLQVK